MQAVAIKDLPMLHDADKLHLAFALWAEGFAACVPQQQQAGKKKKQGGGTEGGEGQKAKKKAKVAA
jgi:hypothetical protein